MIEILRALCGAMGIPGREAPVMDILEQELSEFDCRRDALGNLIVTVHPTPEGEKMLLLEAHADRIGFMVTDFLEGGFIRVAAAGGVDRAAVMGSEIVVEGINGPVTGIVGAPFPHPAKPHNSAPAAEYTLPEIDALYVDTGLDDPKKHIKIGAQAVAAGHLTRLLGNRVAAPALDNRASCLALIETAMRLRAEPPRAGVTLLFSTREETSGKAVSTAAFSLLPDEAIVVDAAFGNAPDVKPQDGSVPGGGPEIAYSGVLDAELTDRLLETAKSQKMPCQITVLGGDRTGTDADALSVAASGVRTALVSIPVRHMHHAIETTDLDDVRATAGLLAEYARGL